eukprot:scaffold1019_cov97-Skeletonema_marinoi.AAC.1
MEMETAIEYVWTFGKVIIACSPVFAIAAILVFAREDEETEIAKRKSGGGVAVMGDLKNVGYGDQHTTQQLTIQTS